LIYACKKSGLSDAIDEKEENKIYHAPAAVIASKVKRRKANKSLKHLIVLNGDEYDFNNNDLEEELFPEETLVPFFKEEYELPTISFRCLGELLRKTPVQVAQLLAKGTVEIVDYEPDETLPVTAAEKKEIQKPHPKLKPRFGFTFI